MKTRVKLQGVNTLTRGGSIIFCQGCNKILGSVNKDSYRYIKMSLVCSCGDYGNLEFERAESTSDPYERIGRMPGLKNGVAVCKSCGVQLFNVIPTRVKAYSYYVECKCGEKYDLVPMQDRRLGETIKLYKKITEF